MENQNYFGVVYKIILPDDFYYTGSTENYEKRKIKHKSIIDNLNKIELKENKRKLYSHILYNNFKFGDLKFQKLFIGFVENKIELRKLENQNFNLNDKFCLNSYVAFKTEDEIKEYSKQYYENNKDEINEKMKKYYELNKKQFKEYRKQYYENNKDEIKEKNKKYCEENKDNLIEYRKKYRDDNKDKIKEKNKQYCEENKDILKEKNKKYYEDNKDKILEKLREKIICEVCQKEMRKDKLTRHKKSKAHQNKIINISNSTGTINIF